MPRQASVAGKPDRFEIAERKLRHDRTIHQMSMGCAGCAERTICGGLSIEAAVWSCLSLCCDNPDACDRVCRNNPEYASRIHEVGGLKLDLAQAPLLPAPTLPLVVPEIFHGSKRKRHFAPALASISLYGMFDRKEGLPKYRARAELSANYKISTDTPLVLTGIQRDRPLERWWELGKARRRAIIQSAVDCGVVLATTPNYSLFVDRPRWDDLHAMKRIAIAHGEFLEAGLPAALHVNGRTDRDFERWAEFIGHHPEVTHISFEFTTGTGRPTRRRQHAAWLCELAKTVGRPLHLIVRGGSNLLPDLCAAFAGVTFLETTLFLKTMKRYHAVKGETVGWWTYSTRAKDLLDDLFETNWEISRDVIERAMRGDRPPTPAIAVV
ncbi:hypothetical protein ACQR1I_35460 [Bradyrhizobium sp. HKCCYLS2038]|uniref:hypothetical protein n=1 Tax=unclassified Bradyrhizobium TaxID=2631580 RepID=UPI003EB69FF7